MFVQGLNRFFVSFVLVSLMSANSASFAQDVDIEGKVLDIFSAKCASCHEGKNNKGNFNFVLDLEKLIETPRYITVRQPELSLLNTRITSNTMPPPGNEKLTDEEKAAVHDWISQVKSRREIAVEKRSIVSREEIIDAILEDLDKMNPSERRRTRYLTLHHLYNAGDSGKEIELWRRATNKIVNSLSWQTIHVPKKLGPKSLLLRINLDDLNWPGVVWDRLLSSYPYGIEPEDGAEDIARRSNTPLPYIRADWFAFHASRPPLYHEILGLPTTSQELEEMLEMDVMGNIERYRAMRAGFRQSGVSQNNRVIERHPMRGTAGAYWKSYDFAGNAGKQSIFDNPLGPGDGELHFDHDGGEIIFNLPNGLQAYYLEDAEGNRINDGPTNIVRDKSRPTEPQIINGISCMGCHFNGMILTPDQVRDRVAFDRKFDSEVRDTVKELYVEWPDMEAAMYRDMRRFLSALDEARVIKGFEATRDGGFKVDRVFEDVEAVRALSDRYYQTVSTLQAAAELDLSRQEFEDILNDANSDVRSIREELARGTLPRDTFEQKFGGLIDNILDERQLDHKEACEDAVHRHGSTYIERAPRILSCDGRVEQAKVSREQLETNSSSTEQPVVEKVDYTEINDNHYATLKACLDKTKSILSDRRAYKAQLSCLDSFTDIARKDSPYIFEVSEYRSEIESELAKNEQPAETKPEVVIAGVERFNGTYSGSRGYTWRGRPSPNRDCLNYYSMTVYISNGRVEFQSDGRTWRGTINKNGYISISRNNISPRPKSAMSISGPANDASMNSGYCGSGYFRVNL